MDCIYQIKLTGPGPELEELGSPLRFQAPDGTYFVPGQELELLRGHGVAVEVVQRLQERELPVRFTRPLDGAVANPPPDDARLAMLCRLLAEGRADGSVDVRFLGRNRVPPPDGFVLDVAGGRRAYVWQVVPSGAAGACPALHERFGALRELLADPGTRVVLALGSGGIKLFCHAPAIRLLEGIGCAPQIDEIWGTSAGAIAGLLYAQGLSPQAIEQMGYDLYAGRMNLRVRPSKLQFLRTLVRDAFLPSEAPARAGFVDCANGMARMLQRYCERVEPQRPFYSVAFNLVECRPEVLTPEPVAAHLSDLVRCVDAREAALASSTVPLLFVPRPVPVADGDVVHYIDGSTTEDVPLASVVHKWDLDRRAGVETRERLVIVYVKLTGQLDRYRMAGGRMGKLRIMQTVVAASIEHMHRRDRALLEMRPDVELLGLRLPDESDAFFDTRFIPEYLRSAKETFPAQLEEIEAQLRARPHPRST